MKENGSYARNEWVDVGGNRFWFWSDGYARPVEYPADGEQQFFPPTGSSGYSDSSSGIGEWTREVEEIDEDEFEERLIELVNEKRSRRGLDELEVDDVLMEAAGIRAEEASEKYSHERPNGEWADELARSLGYEIRPSRGRRGRISGGRKRILRNAVRNVTGLKLNKIIYGSGEKRQKNHRTA